MKRGQRSIRELAMDQVLNHSIQTIRNILMSKDLCIEDKARFALPVLLKAMPEMVHHDHQVQHIIEVHHSGVAPKPVLDRDLGRGGLEKTSTPPLLTTRDCISNRQSNKQPLEEHNGTPKINRVSDVISTIQTKEKKGK